MHLDQFVLLNAKDTEIVKRSIKELDYHCSVLDQMNLNSAAKVQIHVGGIYGDKEKSIDRFIETYNRLSHKIRKRLVIENDDKSYGLNDCLAINNKTDIPIVFDNLHHQCLNNGENIRNAILSAKKTWKKRDGTLMVDYSDQKTGIKKGTHNETIDMSLFKKFIRETKGIDFDIILEIKDKEKKFVESY